MEKVKVIDCKQNSSYFFHYWNNVIQECWKQLRHYCNRRTTSGVNGGISQNLKICSKAKMLLLSVTIGSLVMGFCMDVSATYYEYSSFTFNPDSPESSIFRGGLDCASYDNKIYVHNGSGDNLLNVRTIDVYTVSVDDMSKGDEFPSSPDYQTRTLRYERTIELDGGGEVNPIGHAEIHVDDWGIFITGGGFFGSPGYDVLHFDLEGEYIEKEVEAGDGPFPTSLLAYDPIGITGTGIWYAASEDRNVYSSTGSEWTFEFNWSEMGGTHGDGMEFVQAPDGTGYIYVSDMTSNYIGQWVKVGDNPATAEDESGWNEFNRFDYVEITGAAKNVEGMGFGALDHFWVTSFDEEGSSDYHKGACLYELGGGLLGQYTSPPIPGPEPIPEPSTLFLLGMGLIGFALLAKRKFFSFS